MPARKVCQNFFRNALAPFHKYRQNGLIDATVTLINGASLTLTSIGLFLPGQAQVKNKIKCIDRLLGNEALQKDIPMIFKHIISMLTSKSLCVIAVNWSGYLSQEHHALRASLLCDGRAIPLLSKVVPSQMQNNSLIQNQFLDSPADAIFADTRVIIVTDAGFHSPWFRHITSLGWDFIGRIILRSVVPPATNKPVVLRASGANSILTELSNEAVALSMDDAVRLNSCAVAAQVYIGSEYEHQSIKNIIQLIDAGIKVGMPQWR